MLETSSRSDFGIVGMRNEFRGFNMPVWTNRVLASPRVNLTFFWLNSLYIDGKRCSRIQAVNQSAVHHLTPEWQWSTFACPTGTKPNWILKAIIQRWGGKKSSRFPSERFCYSTFISSQLYFPPKFPTLTLKTTREMFLLTQISSRNVINGLCAFNETFKNSRGMFYSRVCPD